MILHSEGGNNSSHTKHCVNHIDIEGHNTLHLQLRGPGGKI